MGKGCPNSACGGRGDPVFVDDTRMDIVDWEGNANIRLIEANVE